ncbi:calcium/sodium antiporter [Pontiella sp.]|uniref:calcium/sodium antiporter n=1 Tax=Pontiella sp. TaxID=2837462 RepID=UPI0035646AC3
MILLLFIAGLVFLILGAEGLVRGASRLAAALGISPLVIGLTVVAFGTSAPELAVSIKSALSGQPDIAVGNVVGSNIFNVLFILGLSAIIAPLAVSRRLVRYDVPLMIVLSVLALVLGVDGVISRTEGLLLFLGLVVYVGFLFWQGHGEGRPANAEGAKPVGGGEGAAKGWAGNLALVFGGLVLLAVGSRWLVDGAVAVARHLGVNELVVGLTIVAAGTSLPEVATSVMASIRGERDIAVGNVVGSNLFNIMGVLGIAGIAAPAGVAVSDAAIRFDLPVMVAVAFACLPIFFTGGIISRWEGLVLLGYYAAYSAYLLLAAAHHDALAWFSLVMLFFVVPLTAITLAILTAAQIKKANGLALGKTR